MRDEWLTLCCCSLIVCILEKDHILESFLDAVSSIMQTRFSYSYDEMFEVQAQVIAGIKVGPTRTARQPLHACFYFQSALLPPLNSTEQTTMVCMISELFLLLSRINC